MIQINAKYYYFCFRLWYAVVTNQGIRGYQDVPAWLSLILAAHRVIRSAAKTAMSHARTSLNIPDNFLFFVPLKGVLKRVTAFRDKALNPLKPPGRKASLIIKQQVFHE
ncbi:MAG: hypothetical protein DRH04_06000 [Deltaproteobacteria bacterium]|nr:MAG: hypothetical protein DRH04_06000 [Deltaproteobacteria bacterium]